MDDKKLTGLRDIVSRAEELQKQIKELEDVIASCKAEVGYMGIVVNLKNQNEINLHFKLSPRLTFDSFKDGIKASAEVLKEKLEEEYKNLNYTEVVE